MSTQNEWALCSKCQSGFYYVNQSTSVCPDGGTHSGSGSDNYTMTYSGNISSGIARDQLSGASNSGSTGTSFTIQWTTNPASGSKVLVAIGIHGTTVSSVKDNGTTQSTFTADKSDSYGSGSSLHSIYIYRADGITLPSSGAYQLTVTLAASGASVSAGAASYTGVATGGPSTSSANTSTGTAVSTGSATPPSNGLVLASFQDSSSQSSESITLNSSDFTERLHNSNGNSGQGWAMADAITSNAENCSWTLGDSVQWCAAEVTYAAA